MGVFVVNSLDEMAEKVRWNMDTYHQEVLCENTSKAKRCMYPSWAPVTEPTHWRLVYASMRMARI
jgi:restriction endonuclease Mrr